MNDLIKQVKQELLRLADESLQQSGQRFFKEKVKAYGIKMPLVKAIAKKARQELKTESKETIFGLCEELWRSGYIEESMIACEWAFSQHKKFAPGDLVIFEKWIATYITNWASCDTFCNQTVGAFLLQYPEYAARLKIWALAENRWMRRAASVSLIVPARQGKYLNTALEIAQLQIRDEDDLVQKGYGWMLKVASQKHEKAVFDFIMQHKAAMPRTALRYALEKMPAELKAQGMCK